MYALAVFVLALFVAIYVIPAPSVAKSLLITNQTGESLQLNLSSQTPENSLSAELPDGQTTNFVYFRGDYGRLTLVDVRINILGRATGKRLRSTWQLPIQPNSNSTNVIINRQHLLEGRE